MKRTKRHIYQGHRPEKDWFRVMRNAHYHLVCERNARAILAQVPNNFGIVTPRHIAYARELLEHSRVQFPLPLP